MMIDHDVAPGYLDHCQICGSHDLREIIDLGHQPLCDALLTKEELHFPEATYPLRLMQCANCTLAQLDYVVAGEVVYPRSYPYRAGLSWPVVAAHKEMAKELVERYGKGWVVDIGSNDGTLLAQFKEHGCEVLGYEPTDIGRIARHSGIPTNQEFFGESSARWFESSEKAHIITMTNVFAHMADLGNVMRGIDLLLDHDGILVIENHYLLDIFEHGQFDSIYHEHVRTYTLVALHNLFEQYGMQIFDVQRVPRYGGNIRVHVSRKGKHLISSRVSQYLRDETSVSMTTRAARFRHQVLQERDAFRQFMVNAGTIVGCSAPGRASTLLNFYGLDQHDMLWTGELAGSLKIGKVLPGSHIPVVENTALRTTEHDVILLAWHYAKEIAARLRKEGAKSRLYVPLPHFKEF